METWPHGVHHLNVSRTLPIWAVQQSPLWRIVTLPPCGANESAPLLLTTRAGRNPIFEKKQHKKKQHKNVPTAAWKASEYGHVHFLGGVETQPLQFWLGHDWNRKLSNKSTHLRRNSHDRPAARGWKSHPQKETLQHAYTESWNTSCTIHKTPSQRSLIQKPAWTNCPM